VPWARVSVCMERPQPGQKAAVSGIWAAQCGHDVSGTLLRSIVGHHIKTAGGQQIGLTCALTPSRTDSMFRPNFCAADRDAAHTRRLNGVILRRLR